MAHHVGAKSALLRLIFFAKISRPPAPLLLLFAKSHARLTCSVASALTTVRCRYQLFASCVGVSPPAKTVKTSPPQAAYRLRRLFCKSRRVRSLRCSSFPKKVTPRLRCSLAGALATLRLATNLFRAAGVQSCQGNFRKFLFIAFFTSEQALYRLLRLFSRDPPALGSRLRNVTARIWIDSRLHQQSSILPGCFAIRFYRGPNAKPMAV